MQTKQKALKLGLTVAALVALSALGGTAYAAATAQSTLPVSATVSAVCTIDASGGLAFGAYDPTSANASTALDQEGNITATCTNGATASIKLDLGQNAGEGTQRKMIGTGSQTLDYNLYTEPTRTTEWDDAATVSVTADGTPQTIPVYGSIPAGQNVSIDSYSDSVTATITF